MSPRPAKHSRENFESGKVDRWAAGAYGHKVRLFVKAGKIKYTYKDPKTGKKPQRTLFHADTPALRKKATASAVAFAEKLRAGAAKDAEREGKEAGEFTIYDVVLLYMRRAPGFPESILSGAPTEYGKGISKQVENWYHSLPEAVRESKTVPKPKTLWADVYHFLRLWKDPRFARSRKVMDLEPADATNYVAGADTAPQRRTRINETDRLSCAINHVMRQYRKTVGLPYNPLEGRTVDRTRPDIPPYEDGEIAKMLDTLEGGDWKENKWQIRGILGAASSGRRIGAILALTEADHDFEAGTVCWEAEHAKGEGYERGDEVLPMTALHRAAVLWCVEHHPNPKGPDAPLFWQQTNPSLPIPQALADRHLKELEAAAGVEHLDQRAFHGFCRATITKAADLYGDAKAAEFAGRTPETIRRHRYKKVVKQTMEDVAGGLADPRKKKEGKSNG
jgi:integrase